MKIKRVGLFAVIFFFIPLFHAKAESSPFIYYYSYEQQAFIVERADGSDSNIFVSYPMPKDHSWVEGPGWSASGKRFAWTSQDKYGHSDDQNAYIFNSETGSVLRFFPNNVQITDMSWSPRDDLLMISYYAHPNHPAETAIIYDAISDKILQLINAGSPTDKAYFIRKYWSPDGQHLFLIKPREMTVVSKEGYLIIQAQMDDSDLCTNYGSLPHQFSNGSLAYLDPHKQALVIESTNGIAPILINLPAGNISLVDWSPNEEYTLIYITPSQTTPSHEVWLLSLESKTIERLLESAYFIGDCNIPFDRTLWNSNGQSVVASAQDELWLVTPSQKIRRISEPTKGKWRNSTPLQWTDDGHLLFVWESSEPSTDTIYAYNPALDKSMPAIPTTLTSYISYFALSSNQHLAYTGGSNVLLSDNNTNTQTNIPLQAPPQYGAISVASLYWHPNQNWFFMLSENIETAHLINVANASGSARYLTTCSLNPVSCFGWLPDTK